MSSEHFGQLAWQFKRVSGSSEQQSGIAVFLQVLLIVSGRATYMILRANSLFTYAQKPRTETEEKACSSERAKEADR
jgi:hypothetical protein